jgi:lipoprotein-releasing system permease protein
VRIAIGGIAIGMGVMIVAVAIVTGFREEIKNKVVGFEADIRITHLDNNHSSEPVPVVADASMMERIGAVKGVRHIQAFANKAGIIRTDTEMEGIMVKGVGPDFDWGFFRKHLVKGDVFEVSDTGRTDLALISQQTADRLGLDVGSRMEVYFLQKERQRARLFRVSGIYRTGLEEMDRLYILADMAHVQRLNDWDSTQVAGYDVFCTDFGDVVAQADAVDLLLPYDHFAQTIRELQPQMFDWLDLQDVNVLVIIILMLFVAGFNMISALLIMILERVNMIGLLKTMGMTNGAIRNIFLYQGIYLSAVGLFWGNVIGIGACLLQMQTGMVTLPEESYYMSVVPINLDVLHLVLLNLGSLLISCLMLVGPSFMVARISPLRAVRYS